MTLLYECKNNDTAFFFRGWILKLEIVIKSGEGELGSSMLGWRKEATR